jgi:hypothetical protein
MKSLLNTIALLFVLFASISCQSTSFISSNYKGLRWKKIPNKNDVSILDIKTKKDHNLISDQSRLASNGYKIFGMSTFHGEIEAEDSVKSFAASIGADCVVRGIDGMAIENRSRMALSSYTPGRIVYGNSNSYSSTNVNLTSSNSYSYRNTINTYGNLNTNTNTSTSVYVPGSSTYSREDYKVLTGRQIYVFLVSPQQLLNNLESYFEVGDIHRQFTKSDMEKFAANYSQIYALRIPDRFRGEYYNSIKNHEPDKQFLNRFIENDKKSFRSLYILRPSS